MTIQQTFDPAIPLADISEHPDNPRRGDDSVVAESIEANGFFGAILVHKQTGHVLAGNTRYRVMTERGDESVPGFWVDCDDETAKRIMLVDNRASDLAYYDDEALVDLLGQINNGQGLIGTGYDQTAYELLLQASTASGDVLGGVRQGLTPADRAQNYEESDIRSIILPYSHDDYEFVVDGLSRLRSEFGVDTNAEVIVMLVRGATED